MGAPSASVAAESRAALEKLLPREEAELLRAADESRQLHNEMIELRFKHCAADDVASTLASEIALLDAVIEQSAADRAHLDAHGTLPPPSLPPLPALPSLPAGADAPFHLPSTPTAMPS